MTACRHFLYTNLMIPAKQVTQNPRFIACAAGGRTPHKSFNQLAEIKLDVRVWNQEWIWSQP